MRPSFVSLTASFKQLIPAQIRKFTIALISLSLAGITFASLPAQATLVKKTITYHLAGRDYEGYVAYDDASKALKPGVLVAHNWMGITDGTREHVEELAKEGFVAFAVDIYGKGVRPKNTDEAAALAGGLKKDRMAIRMRMQEGLKVLRDMPNVDKNRLAAIGYCFGGTSVLELARTGAALRSVVSFHGGLDSPKPDDGKRIKAKLLILHGADDPFESPQDLTAFENELRNAKVDWQLVKYGNAVHSFTDKDAGSDNSKGAAYNELADKRSWLAMQNFFKETL